MRNATPEELTRIKGFIQSLAGISTQEWDFLRDVLDHSFKSEFYRLTKDTILTINPVALDFIEKDGYWASRDLFIVPYAAKTNSDKPAE